MDRLGATFSLPGTIERPAPAPIDSHTGGGDGWIVTVYDNDYNTQGEVVHILMVATGCCEDEALMEMWEVDNLGKSVVHHGDKQECEGVAAVIAQIGIEVQVSEE